MNFITVSAKLVDQPKSLDSKIPCCVCNIEIAKPAFGKSYVPVYAELKIWGKNSSLLAGAPQGQQIIIIDGEFIGNYQDLIKHYEKENNEST